MKKSQIGQLGMWSLALAACTALAVGCASNDGDEGDGDGDGSGGGNTGGQTGGDGDGDGDTDMEGVCYANGLMPVKPENAMVADMEGKDAASALLGWDIYASTPADKDTGAVLTAPAGTDFEVLPEWIEGADNAMGAGGASNMAKSQGLSFAGTGWISYGAGMNFNLEGCKDLSEYEGVQFYIKGSSTRPAAQELPPTTTEGVVSFRIVTSGSHAEIIDPDTGANVGGNCVVASNKCFLPPQKNVPVTSDWTLVKVPFSDLKTPAGAYPGSALNENKDNAMLLGWHSENGDFEISLDDVSFY